MLKAFSSSLCLMLTYSCDMPNGRPGDHPLTDILVHHETIYGPRSDALIREIVEKLGGKDELERRFNLRHPYQWDIDLKDLEAGLQKLRDELLGPRAEAAESQDD